MSASSWGPALKGRSAAVSLALLAALALTACSNGGQDPASHGMDHGSSARDADVNNADVMFTTMMIPHHEQAMEMSDVVLAKDAIDPRVAALAERIKQAQGPEIAQMEQWLEEWDADMRGMDGGGHDSGMMDAGDMAALEDAEGEAAMRVFLEQMIEHHEGAVDMAKAEVANGRNADVVGLARAIIASQTAEIQEMKGLLDGW